MLEATNIRKSYGELDVLRGVDLSIQSAEVVSIVGKSGAGKSTLLHILGTLDRPDTGQLRIDGEEVFGMRDKRLAAFRNERIGFVFQFHHLLPEFTALENVCIPAYIGNRDQQLAEQRGRELLDYLGLKNRAGHKPGQLSGGEQQRVAVARALMNEPAIVFADEPSGNLDSVNSRELHDLLFRLRDDFSQSFVIVTHNESLAQMSDRRLEMIDGVLV
ncbi:lipoprotein-releasing system ATP-binding protein [Neolewinella xylanilytica]|uniref:Lipoprotein-releasing system ATP-binding protein n=1 Tax=Neolewinella xylanilytica TaxID=1514080 RepID=A0A2S6I3T4_9BACT|nr:ABC transporter ATP-binding protein [Neolewinella xylanilytica]PPK85848.1 lipoprotein-releasing system ATP-binding protein [Neolewinella xylanilytica]